MSVPRPQHRPFLDIIRWGASWLVLLGHGRYLLFEGIDKVDNPGVVTKAIYLLTGLQHEGVVMFFVVSGFLVGGSIWAALEDGRFNGLDYLVKRAVRIFIVFIPALLIAWLVLALGKSALSDTRVFLPLPQPDWSLGAVACHLSVMQSVYCSVVGSNAPLWSLSYEWILYLIAPLFMIACFSPVALIWRGIAVGLLAMSIYTIAPAHILWSWFGYWVMGVVAWRILSVRGLPTMVGIAGLGVMILACIISRAHIAPPPITDFAIAAGLSIAIMSPIVLAWSPAPKLIEYLASFSYSLYVTHLPIATLTVALIERAGWPPTLSQPQFASYAIYALTLIVALLFAAAFARLTEDHTATARKYLLNTKPRKPAVG